MLKSKAKYLSVLLLIFMIAACGDTTVKTQEEYLDAAQKKYEEQDYQGAIDEYEALIKNYPNSDNAIFSYNQIAGIYFEGLKYYPEAINTYQRLADEYPDTKEAKQSLFMIAFIYDETLKDKDKAIESYKVFLEKYPEDEDPNDKMSESAKMMLQVLESGESIEDLIMKQIQEGETAGDKNDAEEVSPGANLKKIEPIENDPATDEQKKTTDDNN